ncbi:MAG: guanylate kinase [Pyrinomonadaceae bacterium]
MRGNLYIISSPSGGGKGTLIKRLFEGIGGLTFSVSYTTRTMREGETDGVEYNFVTRERFEELITEGEFLEYATVHGNYYGTSRAFVEGELQKGLDVVLEIDVQGARTVRERWDGAVGIFILPPSYVVLRERLTARETEKGEVLETRIRNAAEEVLDFKFFDYVIINDDLETATSDMVSIFRANRLVTDRQMPLIQGILDTFDGSQ